jgi:ribonuclease VapC
VSRALMVESSALVAIILEESGWRQLAEEVVRTSAFTTCFNVFEATLAIVRERRLKPSEAHRLVVAATLGLAIEIVDYEADAIPFAIAGREKFGAGKHGLNTGDCLSYGAAKSRRAQLLYVGEDFARTDVNDSV